MRPPICAICGRSFLDKMEGGGLVLFVLSNEEEAFNQKMKSNRVAGHPAGQDWFCSKHIVAARKLSHLSLQEAITQLKND